MRASQMNAIDRPGVFDRHLFGISAEFAERMDPQQRLSLMVAYEALTMAGYAPGSKGAFDAASVGSFIAACSDE